ncbi:tetratricopeptide repeat protein [candidate division WOR-3 bacterium]|nr:tetratricopeptide repeat protein [candidate division WOR-3 bacterium]
MRMIREKIVPYWIILIVLFLLLIIPLQAQKIDLKQQAIDEFKNGNYPEAILLLEQAVSKNPDDAEIYYNLGYYTHYLCYDSRPLSGFNERKSDEILEYLNKAISLNPMYGNAYYFIGVEHGVRFLSAMIEGNIEKMRTEIQTGYEKKGYPDWLVEYVQNMLSSCAPNAILFTGGDPDTWATWYLQFIKGYRTDITVIPVGLLDRPGYAMVLKNGFRDIIPSVPISWSDEQILNMHPYKWKTKKIEIPIKKSELEKFNISLLDSIMEWELESNLSSDSRTLLSAGRALLADIVETNNWERPIYFSVACPGLNKIGLDKYIQLCGLANRLLPIETEKYEIAINPQEIEAALLQSESYQKFCNVKKFDIPRASALLNNYQAVLLRLAKYYTEEGNINKARDILSKMDKYISESCFSFHPGLKKLKENLHKSIEEVEK